MFYVQLLRTQVARAAFLCLHLRFVLYWCKPTGAKAARRTLMKLSPDAFVLPARISITEKIVNLCQILHNLKVLKLFGARRSFFSLNGVPQSISPFECGPPINLSLRPLIYRLLWKKLALIGKSYERSSINDVTHYLSFFDTPSPTVTFRYFIIETLVLSSQNHRHP